MHLPIKSGNMFFCKHPPISPACHKKSLPPTTFSTFIFKELFWGKTTVSLPPWFFLGSAQTRRASHWVPKRVKRDIPGWIFEKKRNKSFDLVTYVFRSSVLPSFKKICSSGFIRLFGNFGADETDDFIRSFGEAAIGQPDLLYTQDSAEFQKYRESNSDFPLFLHCRQKSKYYNRNTEIAHFQ